MRTRRSVAAAPPAADISEDKEQGAARLDLGITASIYTMAASTASAVTLAVNKAAKNFSRGEAAAFAVIVAVWIALFAVIVGLPSGGDELPIVPDSGLHFADNLWGALAVPMAMLDSARDALLSIPDMLPSFGNANYSTEDDSGDAGSNDDGGVSVDYDQLAGRLLENHKFREAVARATEAKMGQVRDEVMRQADERLEKVRLEVRSAVAADSEERTAAMGRRDERMAAIEGRIAEVEEGHAAAAAEARKCCERFDEAALRKRVNDAVSAARVPRREDKVRVNEVEVAAELDKVVADAIRVYDADKTGMFDFALESAGGTIASIRCTDSYAFTTAIYSVMGLPIWWENTSPRIILQPGSSPGQCWAFKGSQVIFAVLPLYLLLSENLLLKLTILQGAVVVRLSTEVNVTAVTLEHISKMTTPDMSISSAPRRFAVLGLRSVEDPSPSSLGNFTYEDSGEPVQTFVIEERGHPSFSLVELKILDNHGNMAYTCVYRFRVHGTISKDQNF